MFRFAADFLSISHFHCSLRERGWDLFGIKPPHKVRVGQIYFNQPPKRIIVLQRHLTRSIVNVEELMARLNAEFRDKRGFEVELVTTASLKTAEDNVRAFSRAGVLITPHGSQAQGLIWQARHSAIIEVMPVGYTDYAFSLLAENCKVWHYEVQSLLNSKKEKLTNAYYSKYCHRNRFSPCNPVKNEGVVVPLNEIARTISHALERLGYPMGTWPNPHEAEEPPPTA